MKRISALMIALSLFACQKQLDNSATGELTQAISNEVLAPLACHSTSFSTNYSILPGKVPPFRFTKTLYADTRVKTINMLSRANPIHPAFKPQAWELIGTFTYGINTATLNGTKQLWEYYKTTTGASAKRSIIKKNVSLKFFLYSNDEPGSIQDYYSGTCYRVYNNLEKLDALRTYAFPSIRVEAGSDEPELSYSVNNLSDDAMIIESSMSIQYKLRKRIKFSYKPSIIRSVSYQPTQNWISLEYSLLEVMQWLPHSYFTFRERTSVSVEFYPYNTSYKVVQSQLYKNHKYDLKGNLLSYTYADNVLQKTTWYCK